jgi:Flp pilus assembly protein TadD
MNRLPEITEEHVAAAQLRIVLDNKLGRQTPDVIRRIAEMTIGDSSQQEATSRQTARSAAFLSVESREEQLIELLRASHGQQETEDLITMLRAIPERYAEVQRRWSQQVAGESVTAMANSADALVAAVDAIDSGALANLAALLAAAGDADRAEQLYRRAVEAGDTKAMANLAALLVVAGRAEEAEEWFRRAATDSQP